MAENKTQPTDQNVDEFINGLQDEQQRQDSQAILGMMQEVTGEKPVMWGEAIVGFGRYDYKYASGRSGTWFLTGLAPRKRNMSLYIMAGFDRYPELMERLGKYKTGVGCLYINRLQDVDFNVLRELVTQSVAQMRASQVANG